MNLVDHFQKTLLPDDLNHRLGPTRALQSGVRPFIPLCETVLGAGIIFIAGVGFSGDQWGLLNIQPHPLWIIVLAISVRYGGLNGYLAGGISATVYGLLLWMRPDHAFQVPQAHEMIQPLLMFIAGSALGELVRTREHRVADLETRCDDTAKLLKSLWDRYKAQETVKVELARQVAFQTNSVRTLAMIGKKLQSLSVTDLHQQIVDLAATFLEVDACALYLCDNKEQLLYDAGIPEHRPGRPDCLTGEHPLIGLVLQKNRAFSIRDQLAHYGSDDDMAADAILMAGPLTLSNGQIYGVVVIESAPFASISPAAIDRLDMILHWASAALENALLNEQMLLANHGVDRMQPRGWSFRLREEETSVSR